MTKEIAVNRTLPSPRSSRIFSRSLALAAAFAIAFASCTDSVGIFASLSVEQATDTNSTKDLANVTPSSVSIGKLNGTDGFFMASGLIYYRPLVLAKNGWKKISSDSIPAVTDAATGTIYKPDRCLQIVSDGTTLYAAWLDNNLNSIGLYSTTDGANWTPVAPAGSATPLFSDFDKAYTDSTRTLREITRLFYVNGTVFAAVKQTALEGTSSVIRFKLYTVSGTTATDSGVSLQYDSTDPYSVTPIRSLTYGNGSYWFVSGTGLYASPTNPNAFTKDSAIPNTATGLAYNYSLTSVLWSDDLNRLLVATGSGVFDKSDTETSVGVTPGIIYARTAAGTWEASAASTLTGTTTGGYANFTDLAVVQSSDGTPVVIASVASSIKYNDGDTQSNKAAAAHGYGVLVPASDSISGQSVSCSIANESLISTYSSYEISLKDYSVNRLFYLSESDGTKVLFAGTLGKGLWSDTRSSSGTWGGWAKE
jgi:hypothetical protein